MVCVPIRATRKYSENLLRTYANARSARAKKMKIVTTIDGVQIVPECTILLTTDQHLRKAYRSPAQLNGIVRLTDIYKCLTASASI